MGGGASVPELVHFESEWADEAFAKEAAANSQTPGDDWSEDGHAAWWRAKTEAGAQVTKREVLERVNPGKEKDTAGSSYTDLVAATEGRLKESGAAAGDEEGDARGWAESLVLAVKTWWQGADDAGEMLAFQLKSLVWGKTKKGVNGYVLAWLDFVKAHPVQDGQGPPTAVVPDAAPPYPHGNETYPNGSDGPGDQVVYTGWRWVYNMLRAQAKNYGTTNADGCWERRCALGSQVFNGAIWPEVDPHSIGLGQTQENHAFVRPLFTRVVGHHGNWTQAQVDAAVDALFASHRPINTTALKEWGTVLLHKIHLDIDLTPDEAAAFIKVQGKILISPALSEGQVNNWLVKQVLALAGAAPHQINAFKATWLARYEAALAVHPLLKDEAAGWTPRQRTLVASNFFDSLMFAGGISVPTVLGLVLAVAANPASVGLDPGAFALTAENATGVVWEVVRFFSPVGGYNIWDKKAGRRWQLQLAEALCDKRAWGADAGGFNPGRSLADFHKFGRVAWAWPGIGGDDPESTDDAAWGAPNAHACPGFDLSFKWSVSFATKWAAAQADFEVVDGDAAGISVNGYGSSDPLFARKDDINKAGVFSVTVVKCSNLKDEDTLGKSDPYVVVRVGARGSDWGAKRGGEHEAKTKKVADSLDPEFGETLAVAYGAGTRAKRSQQLELHIGVFDQDDWNAFGDDSLGACAIPVGWDALEAGETFHVLDGGRMRKGEGVSTITLSWKRVPASSA